MAQVDTDLHGFWFSIFNILLITGYSDIRYLITWFTDILHSVSCLICSVLCLYFVVYYTNYYPKSPLKSPKISLRRISYLVSGICISSAWIKSGFLSQSVLLTVLAINPDCFIVRQTDGIKRSVDYEEETKRLTLPGYLFILCLSRSYI